MVMQIAYEDDLLMRSVLALSGTFVAQVRGAF
jgi:hypothetical protein